LADTTFWAETDGKDETYGLDETTEFDDALDASIFISAWTEYEGIYQGVTEYPTSWDETDGRDEGYGLDELTGYASEDDAAIFMSFLTGVDGTYEAMTDAVTSSFEMGNKVYFLTGTDFIYWDGTTAGKVTDIAYVPTITLGRKTTGGGTANEKLNHLSNSWIDSFSPDGTATTFPLSYGNLSDTLVTAVLNGVDKSETAGDFTVNRVTGVVTFNSAPPAGTDTLQIQAEVTDLMDATVITGCNLCIEFGGKNNAFVFVAGNDDYPNVARYCWVYNPTYWPEDSDISVGNDSRLIKGFGRMNDYLITYKEPGDEFVQWYSELELDTSGDISVSTYGLNDEFGCIAPRSVHPAQNGLLALSDRGVTNSCVKYIQA
jgi:hypothetical protein